MKYVTIRIDRRRWYYDRFQGVLRWVKNPNVELDVAEAELKLIEEQNALLRLIYNLRRINLKGGTAPFTPSIFFTENLKDSCHFVTGIGMRGLRDMNVAPATGVVLL